MDEHTSDPRRHTSYCVCLLLTYAYHLWMATLIMDDNANDR